MSERERAKLSDREFSRLADFRYQIRRFLAFTQEAAEAEGFQPQQYQLLLALRGFPSGEVPTVAALAERMQLRHNSTVELVDRCIAEGLLAKSHDSDDRRKVVLRITRHGAKVLGQLSHIHLEELRVRGPELIAALEAVLEIAEKTARVRKPASRTGKSLASMPSDERLEQWLYEQWQKHK
jgi:DNA-binding MarR family transcriptional regulator